VVRDGVGTSVIPATSKVGWVEGTHQPARTPWGTSRIREQHAWDIDLATGSLSPDSPFYRVRRNRSSGLILVKCLFFHLLAFLGIDRRSLRSPNGVVRTIRRRGR
jgi:hypothetical protein